MDSWLDRDGHPATRPSCIMARMIRCFVERPRSVHAMLENAVARRAAGTRAHLRRRGLSYAELDALVGEAAGAYGRLGSRRAIASPWCSATASRLSSCSSPSRGSARCRFRSTSAIRSPRTATSSRIARRRSSSTKPTSPTAFPRRTSLPSLKHAVAIPREGGAMLAELRGAAPVRQAEAVGEEETATILYTSGTTGRPKGAMLTHLSIAHSVIHYRVTMGLTEDDRGLLAVPMSHVTGLIALVHAMVHCAGDAGRHARVQGERIHRSRGAPSHDLLAHRAGDVQPLSARAQFRNGGSLLLARLRLRRGDHAGGHARAHRREAAEAETAQLLRRDRNDLARGDHAAGTDGCAKGVRRPRRVLRRHSGDGRERREAPYGQPGEIYIGGAMVVPGYFNNRSHRARVQRRILEVRRSRDHG